MARQKGKLQSDYDEGQNQQQRLKQLNDEKECTIMTLKQEIESLKKNQNKERKIKHSSRDTSTEREISSTTGIRHERNELPQNESTDSPLTTQPH